MKILQFFIEILRILIIVFFGTALLAYLESTVYESLSMNVLKTPWYVGLANLIIMVVLYRNYFQFKGWYKSEKNKKLPKWLTLILIGLSLLLIIMPIFMV